MNDYIYLTKDSAKLEDKVMLVNPSPSYSINRANPVIHSIHFCYGVVKDIRGLGGISVKWDNGLKNVYNDNELALVEKKPVDKNRRYISVW